MCGLEPFPSFLRYDHCNVQNHLRKSGFKQIDPGNEQMETGVYAHNKGVIQEHRLQWCLGAVKKTVQIFQRVRPPNLCTLQPSEPGGRVVWSNTGESVSAVVLLMLMVLVFGVESLEQGSQDAPWDLLVHVYQRLDSLLHFLC